MSNPLTKREKFGALLKSKSGINNIYFQPPSNIKMIYPCIVYALNDKKVNYANNDKYKNMDKYSVIIIDKNPDSIIPSKIEKIRYSSFSRFYVAENLNHFAYEIFY